MTDVSAVMSTRGTDRHSRVRRGTYRHSRVGKACTRPAVEPYGVFPETGGGDLIAPTPDGEPVHKLSLHFVARFTIFSSATDTIPEQARTPSLASSHWSKGREGSKPVSYTHLTLPTNREV